ncbi:MAG: DnaJ domain-containing protein [Myxococcota bacterium]
MTQPRTTRLEEILLEQILQRNSGALEVVAGPQRRIFFFEEGRLVSTRSNLVSEGAPAIIAAMPDASSTDRLRAHAARRVAGALALSNPTWNFASQAATDSRLPLQTTPIMLDALAEAHDFSALRQMVAPLLVGHPKKRSDERVQLDGHPALSAYLDGLDGTAAGEMVLTQSPAAPEQTLAAMWWSWKMGWLAPGEPADGLNGVLDFDLDALLEEEINRVSAAAPAAEAIMPAGKRARGISAASRLDELARRIEPAENHFIVLGLPWDADVDDFKRAYRELARDLHPDRFAQDGAERQDLAARMFDRARAAWEVIGDPDKRRAYTDQVIHGKKSEEEEAMEQLEAYWAAESDFKRGLAAFNQGQISVAHEAFSSAVAAAPDELEFRAYHAYTSFVLIRGRDPAEAQMHINTIKEVIELNKQQERKLDSAWTLLGRCYRERGQMDRAHVAFLKALKINPANADANLELRRLTQKKEEKNSSFLSRLFGGSSKK